MLPTSDPKTSQNSEVAFLDRLYVAGNASFICLFIAALWTFSFVAKVSLSMQSLIVMSGPLVATGSTVLLAGLSKSIIPKPVISRPINFSLPIIWCLTCYLTISLLSTRETGPTQAEEALLPALTWLSARNLLPVCIAQVLALTIVTFFDRRKA